MINERVAVFISGRGSNLKALLDDSCGQRFYVFTNKKKCSGLDWAKRRGHYVDSLNFKDEGAWAALVEKLNFFKIDKVLLLGFMKLVPASFLESLEAEIVNLHPSLLPDFPGLNSLEKTLKARRSVGCSLHHVTAGMDEGPLIYQKKVDLNQRYDDEQEAVRVHSYEQILVSKYMRQSVRKERVV